MLDSSFTVSTMSISDDTKNTAARTSEEAKDAAQVSQYLVQFVTAMASLALVDSSGSSSIGVVVHITSTWSRSINAHDLSYEISPRGFLIDFNDLVESPTSSMFS